MNMAQMLLYSARCSPEPDGRGQSGCWSHYRWRPNYICGVSNLWRIKQSAGIQFIITLLWCLDSLQQCLVVWKSTECPFGCDASSYKPLYVQYKTFVSCCLPHSGVSPLFSSTTCTLSALKMFCCTEIKPCKECMYLFGTQRCIHCNNTMRAIVWGCLLDFYINIFYTLCLIYIIDFFLNVTSTTFPCFFDVFLCCYLNNNQISPWFFFFCLTDFSVFSVLRSSGEVFLPAAAKHRVGSCDCLLQWSSALKRFCSVHQFLKLPFASATTSHELLQYITSLSRNSCDRMLVPRFWQYDWLCTCDLTA